MTDSCQPANIQPPEYNTSSINMTEQQSEHELRTVAKKVTKKLCFISILNILLGIITIGLDIGLVANDEISSLLTGLLSGLYMIFVGVLILIHCRGQIYVLTNLFILVFFQFYFLTLALCAYLHLMFTQDRRCSYSNARPCQRPTNLIIMINFGLIFIITSVCLSIYTLIIVTNGRRSSRTPFRVVYYPH